MNPLIALGAKKVLREQDMPELPEKDSARYLADRFQRQWDTERETRPQPRLWRALLLAFFPLSLWVYPCLLLSTSAKILQATVGIQNLVRLLDELESGSMEQVYMYGSVIVVCGLVMLTVHHMVLFMGWRLGLAVRTALTAAIYRKALRLPQSTFAANSLSSGYIVNLCSADVERFQVDRPSHVCMPLAVSKAMPVALSKDGPLITSLRVYGVAAAVLRVHPVPAAGTIRGGRDAVLRHPADRPALLHGHGRAIHHRPDPGHACTLAQHHRQARGHPHRPAHQGRTQDSSI